MLLPDCVDRVLYIDAGDVIVADTISPYYNGDFDGNALIVTAARYKILNGRFCLVEEDDLFANKYMFTGICRGLFNSGSYVINLDKLREVQLTIDDYLFFKRLCDASEDEDLSKIYFGDQGFLSVAFLGDIKMFGYPEICDVLYMPYNFCLWYYDTNHSAPPYHPSIIHFVGEYKPWLMNYPNSIKRFLNPNQCHEINELKPGQEEWYYLWQRYAVETDIILRKPGY